MARRRNPVVQAITTGFILSFLYVTARLPLSVNRWVAVRTGRVLARLIPRVRRVARENLDRAFGDSLSGAEKERILRGAVDNIAIIAAEFSHLSQIPTCDLSSKVSIVGREHIVPGQSYLCIGAHLGNWELLGPFMARCGLENVAEIVRPFDDPRVDRAIDRIRCAEGLKTIPKDKSKDVFQVLKEGGLVGVLIDQSPRDSAVPVTFFDAPCWATIAPVMIAVRAKVPLKPVSVIRGEDYRYTVTFHPPITLERTGNLREDLLRNSQRCQDVIEGLVRKNPEQWLWLHRRWKERPRLEAAWAKRDSRAD